MRSIHVEERPRSAVAGARRGGWDVPDMRALERWSARGLCARPPHANGRRFLIVHLDGVSRSRLERGMADGSLPNLNALARDGQHRLSPMYAGAPSSTPSFQAGLLWGVRADVPGFLWFDKRTGKRVRMDDAEDAARVEATVSAGRRGLLEDGTTYFSIFSGGTSVNAWCLTGWRSGRVRLQPGANAWDCASLCAVHARTAARVSMGAVVEGANAICDGVGHAARTGRADHERAFLKNRVLLAAGARAYATYATALDLARGVPSIYTCFADYDEIAHRRGPDSAEALRALASTDRSVGVLWRALRAADRDYDLYVLADHGQVATRPFEQALGGATGRPPSARAAPVRGVSRGLFNLGRAGWRAAQGVGAAQGAGARADPTLEVIEAGDVAHLYFVERPTPLTLEEIEARHPAALAAVLGSAGAGVVAVRGGRAGWAFMGGARIDLASARDCARLQLGYGWRRVAESLRAMLGLPSAGDLVVYGNGVPGGDVAYAWELGSHGGIARDEVETFVIHPAAAPFDFGAVEHASDLYRFFTGHYRLARRDARGPLAAW